MDKETRSLVQRATQTARTLLEHEYSEQLEGVFDIGLGGKIAAKPGEHLDAEQCVVRAKLITAIEHQESSGATSAEAVATVAREAAFTSLNRFVALKMLEARGLTQECVSSGDQSAGFKEFTGLTPGLSQLPDHGYCLYIESLFDEIGREVRVLFDRRDPASLLWPGRQALQELLEVLNAPELASVWVEDETIGWVYQYFNTDEDRRKARYNDKGRPKDPGNSRELAVRNQFFTPRYVVQFLVDNTLGRTWFEMMRGKTSLRNLDYLVRRQHEVFLAEGEAVPAEPEGVKFGETPEHPFPVPFRARKDPRDLKVLDPACGSGHFLLYTFDLLLTIYEEGWQDESARASASTGDTLREDYTTLDALRTAAPELILRHNLHGIDIDPRCTQIAALALWLRAQRAFQEAGLSRADRPVITKTNIVVAEPMPGEADLREAFVATLEPKLAKLVDRVFESMSLAGEAGYLLQITEQIEKSIRQVYGGVGGLFRQSEESEWAQAASDLRAALDTFATQAVADQAFARQLFAGDAARGLGFIDVCNQRYDTILMNPPFGAFSLGTREWAETAYPRTKNDIYAAFIERGIEILHSRAHLGAITSRTGFFLSSFQKWREEILLKEALPMVVADLGYGVMDDAIRPSRSLLSRKWQMKTIFLRALEELQDKGRTLRLAIRSANETAGQTRFEIDTAVFGEIPGSPFAYWLSEALRCAFTALPKFGTDGRTAKQGLATANDFRFLRSWLEVGSRAVNVSWIPFAKGGEFSPFYADLPLVVRWEPTDEPGGELKAFAETTPGTSHWSRRIASSEFYFRPGLTYPRRLHRLAVMPLPEGSIFSVRGQGIFVDKSDLLATCGLFSSTIFDFFAKCMLGRFGHPEFNNGILCQIPVPRGFPDSARCLEQPVRRAISIKLSWESTRETSHHFVLPAIIHVKKDGLKAAAVDWGSRVDAGKEELARISSTIDEHCFELYDVNIDDRLQVAQGFGETSESLEADDAADAEDDSDASAVDDVIQLVAMLLSWCLGVALGRFDLRLATGECPVPPEPEPFDPLPACSPGMLAGVDSLPLDKPPAGYPIDFPRDGILVDDAGAAHDLVTRARRVFELIFDDPAARWDEAAATLDDRDRALMGWFAREFFELHIKLYSKSRRKAPIYWQLATPSASYSTWLYYHRFTRDTLFRLLNDHVAPKLQHEERKLTNLTQDTGPNPTASQRKEIDSQESFVSELRAFRDEVARVAPLWNPNLDDGVILNFAPLWRLVPQHRSWQKECKSAWDKLCKGDYDWAHVSMHLWPERVVPKCAKDRSLAIAHGLEEVFREEDEDGKWQSKTVSEEEVARLVAERTSPAVKDALKSLLEAPAPASNRGRTSRRRKKTGKSISRSRAPKLDKDRTSQRATAPDAVDSELLNRVRAAIASMDDGAGKSDVLNTTGISNGEWNQAIKALLLDGSVNRTGERRGTKYHVVRGQS